MTSRPPQVDALGRAWVARQLSTAGEWVSNSRRSTVGPESLLARAAELGDAAGDPAKTSEIVGRTASAPGGFDVLSGSDEYNLPILAVGGVGVISVAAHLAGDQIAEMVRLVDTDLPKARQIHNDLLPLVRALFSEASPAPVKGALNRMGLPAGPVRGPLIDALPDTVDAVFAALDHAGVTY